MSFYESKRTPPSRTGIFLNGKPLTRVFHRYCPPKLLEQGAVWIGFSTVGLLVGGGP